MDAPSPLARRLTAAAHVVQARVDATPRVALILGSGLGALADRFDQPVCIPYASIDGMAPVGVPGHAGNLVSGMLEGAPVVAMQGRVHLYEGHAADAVVFGVRLMHRLGARTLIVTNAAGGVDPALRPGDLALVEDHLNLTGHNPLLGPSGDSLGPRFVDMTEAYDGELRSLAEDAAAEVGTTLGRAVYAGLLGPSYETPAEVRMLRTLGAHAVGMSTVLEVIAARQLGMRVLGITCITNAAAGLSAAPLDHGEVEAVAGATRERFVALLRAIVRRLA